MLGRWSANTVVALGALYLVVLGAGVAEFGLEAPIGDPILALMEVITVLSAVAITLMVAAIASDARRERRVYGQLALTFTGLFAGTTTLVHVIALTAGRQLGMPTMVWPSVLYAAELAAWDALLGIALVCTSMAIEDLPRLRAIRAGFAIAGVLCLVGLVGPALGKMPLQRVGIVGYALILPVVCALVSREFRRRASVRGSSGDAEGSDFR